MRIGIDCRTILDMASGERAGVGHYTYYLVKSLLSEDKKNEYVLFFDSRFKETAEFNKYSNVTIKYFPYYGIKKYLPILYSQLFISSILNKENLDIYHAPANIVPLFYHKKSVVTIHDLGAYKFPEFFPKKFLNLQAFSKKILVPSSLKRVAKVIAVSKHTKKDIIAEFKVPEEKIEVVYEGVENNSEACSQIKNFEVVAEKYGISDKYLLFIGTMEPRKNVTTLIKAFRSLRLAYDSPLSNYQLILAGNKGWNDQSIYQAISDANASILGIKDKRIGHERRHIVKSISSINTTIEKRHKTERRLNQPVKYIGYVSDSEKTALLCQATCFVFPSFYEGFGLPVLEAMSLGVPVVTSNISSLPEITGTDGAVLIDPHKESEISEAIQKIITNKTFKDSLILGGLERSKYFHWHKCARETLTVYKSIQ